MCIRDRAYTTHKVWTQLAETDWYTPSADRFTLTSARQLAGLAQLVKQGNSFAGKTVLLVSHRASTMRIADKVYSVEHGRMS